MTGGQRTRAAALAPFFALLLLLAGAADAAFLRNVPQEVVQPDGTVLRCLATGDENWSWLHDAAGRLIVQDPSGRYVYALHGAGGPVASAFVAGAAQPGAVWTGPPPMPASLQDVLRLRKAESFAPFGANTEGPHSGSLANVIIFVRFSDQSEFPDPPSAYNALYNADGIAANSVLRYYEAASYGRLHIASTLVGTATGVIVSVRDPHTRNYYRPRGPSNPDSGYVAGSADSAVRERALCKNAILAAAAQVPDTLVLDANNDGLIDQLSFVLRGAPDGWNQIIWPHMWTMGDQVAEIHGKRAYAYNIQIEALMPNGVGTLCHELFHTLGAPDLYHYTDNGIDDVGMWDLMGGTSNPPQHMSAWMKYRYAGWIPDIPTAPGSGFYALAPLESGPNALKIVSPRSQTEFFVVEYRSKSTVFGDTLPGSGLIVYRIDSRVGGGNAYGPPDEVYAYRPGGTPVANGDLSRAFFSAEAGRTAMSDTTDPFPFLGDGSGGGLDLSAIGQAGDSIRFTVTTSGAAACPTIAGDASGDGRIDVTDVVLAIGEILQTRPLGEPGRFCADVAPDGRVNVLDLIGIVNRILNPVPSDSARSGPRLGEPPEIAVPWARADDDSTLRLYVRGDAIGGLQLRLPIDRPEEIAGAPRLLGTSPGVRLEWKAGPRSCILLAWNDTGGWIGPDWVELEVPYRRAGDPTDPGLRPDVVVCGPQGEPRIPGDEEVPPPEIPNPSGRARFLSVAPNPTRSGARISCELGKGERIEVALYDAAGRCLRTLAEGWYPAGRLALEWDGRGTDHRPVASGVVFARLRSASGEESRRILVIR